LSAPGDQGTDCRDQGWLLADFAVVPASRRATSIAAAAAVLAAGLAVVLFVLIDPLGSSDTPACSSYPTPGAPAGAGVSVPASVAGRYSLLRAAQRPADRLTAGQAAGLKASGLIMSGTRFLGETASGGRIYLVPAEHLLAIPLAPTRCLSRVQRVIEQESLSVLQREYRQPAVCIDVIYPNRRTQECAAAAGTPYALLSAAGTPAFGLVPNGVSAVTVTYPASPPTTLPVRRNSFVVAGRSAGATPACGVQWLDSTGNVTRVVSGCSYLTPQTHELSEYRAYVAGKLSALRSQVTGVGAAIASGDLAGARSAWLTAHLTWLEIGQDDGAYGAFGDLGGKIDGLAAGHVRGTADPGFTGFHRIEFDLWRRRDLRAAAADTTVLRDLLGRLMKVPLSTYLPADANGIGSWLLRPHEALEDAMRDSLSGNDDYGSGTSLASVTADVTAVRTMLAELRPGLDLFSPGLVRSAYSQLDALGRALRATRVNGAWVSVRRLAVSPREQVNADLGAALETLAPIPDLLTSTGAHAPGS